MQLNNHTKAPAHEVVTICEQPYRKLVAWIVIIMLALAAMAYAMVLVTYFHNWRQVSIMFQLFMTLPSAVCLFMAAWLVVTEIN